MKKCTNVHFCFFWDSSDNKWALNSCSADRVSCSSSVPRSPGPQSIGHQRDGPKSPWDDSQVMWMIAYLKLGVFLSLPVPLQILACLSAMWID